MSFIIQKINNKNIGEELLKIGVDESYSNNIKQKHEFLNLKIYNLTPIQATILKQTALSVGSDVAVNKKVLTHEISKSDVLLSGTIKQIHLITEKLKLQDFKMNDLSSNIKNALFETPKKPKIMGILNLSEDSFSNALDSNIEKNPYKIIDNFIENEVDIIDIGLEATNINSKTTDIETQKAKLEPILKYINNKIKISLDTRRSEIAEFGINHGVSVINDVSCLNFDKNMINIIKKYDVKYVLTHSRGTPNNMDEFAKYDDVVFDVLGEIKEKLNVLYENNIKKENIIIDVGFGFSKNEVQNFELLKNIEIFKNLNHEILVGVSRKRFLQGMTKNIYDLDTLTSLVTFYLIDKNVDIIRVHDPHKTKLAINLYQKLNNIS